MPDAPYQLSVDIGGTFVDAMELDQRTHQVRFRKASTTPDEPWRGVLDAVDALGTDLTQVGLFIHGTTLGLNAVLERRGGATGILTNEGMRDIFLIGRGNIPSSHMYDFTYDRPPPLVERRHTIGVRGRLDHRGREIEPLDENGVKAAAAHLVEQGVRSIAVCFLHSYRDPTHEQRAAAIIREQHPDVTVSTSTSIVREYREYERTATTVLDAYIRPIFERYVTDLERELAARGFAGRFLIMRSGGGSMTADAARRSPTNTVLSGPAGGIIGGCHLAAALGRDDVVTVDIGGTSLDACVIEGGAAASAFEAELEHYPLLIPIYDIRTIGAGGGSIAWLDGGLLKVGPRSAGAVPGPVCYGRGRHRADGHRRRRVPRLRRPAELPVGGDAPGRRRRPGGGQGAPRRSTRHLGRARCGERVRRAARPHRRRRAPDHRRARSRPARLLADGVRRCRPADRPAAGAGDGHR